MSCRSPPDRRLRELATSNDDVARRFVGECRRSLTILPAISTIERLCADALVAAEKRIETRIASRLTDEMRIRIDALLSVLSSGALRFPMPLSKPMTGSWARHGERGKDYARLALKMQNRPFSKPCVHSGIWGQCCWKPKMMTHHLILRCRHVRVGPIWRYWSQRHRC